MPPTCDYVNKYNNYIILFAPIIRSIKFAPLLICERSSPKPRTTFELPFYLELPQQTNFTKVQKVKQEKSRHSQTKVPNAPKEAFAASIISLV